MNKKQTPVDEDYDQYLADLHAGLQTPDDLIQQVVHEATGQNYLLKKRIIAGEVNEVYDISLADDHHIIVRISHKEDPSLEKEIWISKKCKEAGVPVPEIFLVKYVTENEKDYTFSVMEKVEGEPLERGAVDYHDMDQKLLSDIIKKSGEVLSKIHTIHPDGFGFLDKDGNSENLSYATLRLKNAVKEDAYMDLAQRVSFDPNTMQQILTTIRERVPGLGHVVPSLSHRDFAPKHIMHKGTEVTGIIDWQDAESDSPIFDLARWEYWFGDDIPISMLMEGYSNTSLFDDSFEEHKQLIKLDQGLEVLYWYAKKKYQPSIDRAKMLLEKDLDFFK